MHSRDRRCRLECTHVCVPGHVKPCIIYHICACCFASCSCSDCPLLRGKRETSEQNTCKNNLNVRLCFMQLLRISSTLCSHFMSQLSNKQANTRKQTWMYACASRSCSGSAPRSAATLCLNTVLRMCWEWPRYRCCLAPARALTHRTVLAN